MNILPDTETLKRLLANSTKGRRVQFHGSYCKEAEGTPFTEWDMSHDTSVILPDGTRYRGYAHHKHAADAELDGLAPTLAARVIELEAALSLALPAMEAAHSECRDYADTHPFIEQLCDAMKSARAALGSQP